MQMSASFAQNPVTDSIVSSSAPPYLRRTAPASGTPDMHSYTGCDALNVLEHRISAAGESVEFFQVLTVSHWPLAWFPGRSGCFHRRRQHVAALGVTARAEAMGLGVEGRPPGESRCVAFCASLLDGQGHNYDGRVRVRPAMFSLVGVRFLMREASWRSSAREAEHEKERQLSFRLNRCRWQCPSQLRHILGSLGAIVALRCFKSRVADVKAVPGHVTSSVPRSETRCRGASLEEYTVSLTTRACPGHAHALGDTRQVLSLSQALPPIRSGDAKVYARSMRPCVNFFFWCGRTLVPEWGWILGLSLVSTLVSDSRRVAFPFRCFKGRTPRVLPTRAPD